MELPKVGKHNFLFMFLKQVTVLCTWRTLQSFRVTGCAEMGFFCHEIKRNTKLTMQTLSSNQDQIIAVVKKEDTSLQLVWRTHTQSLTYSFIVRQVSHFCPGHLLIL